MLRASLVRENAKVSCSRTSDHRDWPLPPLPRNRSSHQANSPRMRACGRQAVCLLLRSQQAVQPGRGGLRLRPTAFHHVTPQRSFQLGHRRSAAHTKQHRIGIRGSRLVVAAARRAYWEGSNAAAVRIFSTPRFGRSHVP